MEPRIAIIDYNAGNLTSVARAVAHLGHPCRVTHDVGEIRSAPRIIFPGVGAAGAAMSSLKRAGLDAVIRERFEAGIPVLGICLGTQVIMGASEENDTPCLGIVAGSVRSFPPGLRDADGRALKVPHMGWNRLRVRRPHPLLAGIGPEDEFYFVHGYFPTPEDAEVVVATTDYGLEFASVLGYRNLAATQFHLEKSGRPGLRMLDNFCNWNPAQPEPRPC
jgi:glutamine amidotransferase